MSECDNYLLAIEDQDLPTKDLGYKQVLIKGKILNLNKKYRLVCLV